MTRMHQDALRDPQIQSDAKTQVQSNYPSALFVESVPVPSEQKDSVSMFHGPDAPECTT
jgi:hypothetical protein